MQKLMRKRTAVLICLLTVSPALPQESEYIRQFNSGDYQGCINTVNALLPTLPDAQQGIPKYFAGESWYSLGLTSGRADQLRNALRLITESLNHADLRTSDYRPFALYKKGWVLFRLAELGEGDIADRLNQSYEAFASAAGAADAPDEVRAAGAYMAAEAKLVKSLYQTYVIFSRQTIAQAPQGEISPLAGEIRQAADLFGKISQQAGASNELKVAAEVRRRDALLQLGKIEGMSAIGTLNGINYQNVFDLVLADTKSVWTPVLNYSEAFRNLQLFWLSRSDNYYIPFNTLTSALPDGNYSAEKLFRLGNAVQAFSLLSTADAVDNRWVALAESNGYYGRAAAAGLDEARFWLAYVQSILNPAAAQDVLNAYIGAARQGDSYRQNILTETARLLRYQLRLQQAIGTQNAARRSVLLRELVQELERYQSNVPALISERDKLVIKARIAYNVSVGGNIVQIDLNNFQLFNNQTTQALHFIKELTPSAAAVVAEERRFYLSIINSLLRLTENNHPNETRFYRGIVLSLQAEIEKTVELKRQRFSESAEMLNQVVDVYRPEAQYVRGRALFFAGQNNAAEKIFKNLINEHHCLRALYYLAEIFRYEGNKAAARECFRIIRERTQHYEQARFWSVNAEAGYNSTDGDGGDLGALHGIDYTNVQFPDVLSRDSDGQPIRYENLAERRFLQEEKAAEALRLLTLFGLPKRSLYPSRNILPNSWLVKDGIFSETTAPIDERRGRITAGLRIVVVTEADAPASTISAVINGQAVAGDGTVFSLENADVGSTASIAVTAAGYYPYFTEHTFQQPKIDTLYLAPCRSLSFPTSTSASSIDGSQMLDRHDRNMIIHVGQKGLPSKELYQSLLTAPYIRDYVYHPVLNGYLLADAAGNKIVRADDPSKPLNLDHTFFLSPTGTALNSPEGIAVDSEGYVYIADWGNHQLVVTRSNGEVLRRMGSLGKNAETGKPVHFVFPTRIAVAEDNSGIDYRSRKVKRPRLLFVADRNGVHVLDEQGHYYDTVVRADRDVFPAGSFYAVGVEGYGRGMQLYVAHRRDGNIKVFKAK